MKIIEGTVKLAHTLSDELTRLNIPHWRTEIVLEVKLY